MKILFAASEAYPLAKTGGLADVAASLPAALKRLRNDVRLILPAYPAAKERIEKPRTVATMELLGVPEPVQIIEGTLPDSPVRTYLVDIPSLFDRPGGPYSDTNGEDWGDNPLRFAAFCRAVAAVAMDRAGLDWRPCLVHGNDWQTGLVAPLLSLEPGRPATVFTIHNLAYQGNYPWHVFNELNLPPEWWNPEALEFYGNFSFMKGGLLFSDWLTTVSPTYSREIRTADYGYGMEGVLSKRSERLVGILNGVDNVTWNPVRDPALVKNYSIRNLRHKVRNKVALLEEFGMPGDREALLFAYVGRLAYQKGVDLILDILPDLFDQPVQMVLLGSGDKAYEQRCRDLANRFPEQFGVYIGYDEGKAHRVEAGADSFIMPSRYEPCGLNQIYSLRYGTVPIVRHTGGLADTVVDATPRSIMTRTATGFLFDDATPASLMGAVQRAITCYSRPPVWWRKLVVAGMEADFSWTVSARDYMALYKDALRDQGITPAETE